MAWGQDQLNLFGVFRAGTKHAVARAYPGSGKTTTLVAGLQCAPRGRNLATAFSRTIVDTLGQRVPLGTTAKSFHQLAFAMCARAFPGLQTTDTKARAIAEQALAAAGLRKTTSDDRIAFEKIVKHAKYALVDTDEAALAAVRNAEVAVSGLDAQAVAAAVQLALNLSAADTQHVDYDDTIWFPHRFDLANRAYDLVVIDEVQDLNPAQRRVALGCVHPSGRIVAAGDPFQAIFSFAGSPVTAFDDFVAAVGADVYPLSVSYRLPRTAITLAQAFTPEIQAAPDAADGVVTTLEVEAIAEHVRPGDFVVSRANAPLGWVAMELRAARIPARVNGQDDVRALSRMAEDARADSYETVAAYVDRIVRPKVEKLNQKGNANAAAVLEDRAATLLAFARDVDGERITCPRDLIRRIADFYDDTKQNCVILTSTHRAKGLETDRVFVLDATFRPDESAEERNVAYVAVTRCKRELYLCYGSPWNDRPTSPRIKPHIVKKLARTAPAPAARPATVADTPPADTAASTTVGSFNFGDLADWSPSE